MAVQRPDSSDFRAELEALQATNNNIAAASLGWNVLTVLFSFLTVYSVYLARRTYQTNLENLKLTGQNSPTSEFPPPQPRLPKSSNGNFPPRLSLPSENSNTPLQPLRSINSTMSTRSASPWNSQRIGLRHHSASNASTDIENCPDAASTTYATDLVQESTDKDIDDEDVYNIRLGSIQVSTQDEQITGISSHFSQATSNEASPP